MFQFASFTYLTFLTFQNAAAAGLTDPMSELFAEEFSDQMAKQFEESMKNFVGSDSNLMQQIEMLASSADNAGRIHPFIPTDDLSLIQNNEWNTNGLFHSVI